jgi:catechol 2,3-dioxygenase
MTGPVTPRGINHLVLNVRDIEESHRFWTEVVGFRQVGQLTPTKDRPNPPKMRFYSGVREDGTSHHHDVALVENRELPKPPENWSMFGMPCAVNHIAITMPTREAWLAHLAYLQEKGVKFDRRVEHGMTHSLYIHDPNGYGVEFLYLPALSFDAIVDLVSRGGLPVAAAAPDATHGIHSTVRRAAWVYEILKPIRRDDTWHAEIRRAPREAWRPGGAGPFYVVEGASPEKALREAREFLVRLG